MKEKGSLKLIKLYLAYHFNKTFIILLIIVLLFLLIILFVNLGLPINEMEYFSNKNSYHINYLEQSLYFINIINSIIIASLIGNELNSITAFDPMFVSHINRRKIINAKLCTNFLLILIILLFEMIILFLLGTIYYPDFLFRFNDLILIPYQLLYLIELILIGELLSLIFNNFFITIFIFLISLIINILSKINDIKEYICEFIPYIEISSINKYTLKANLFIYMIINLVFYFLILIIFRKKDIK